MDQNLLEFLPNLICPVTGKALKELDHTDIKKINSQIKTGSLFHVDGSLVKKEITLGFISIDGEFAYFVEDGIAILLEKLAIHLDSTYKIKMDFGPQKSNVQDFYNELGWHKESSDFLDAVKFEDLREVSKEYIYKCHMRLKRYIKPSGKYIVDVASGPVQYPEYLEYSKNYQQRICVDFSLLALKEAKKKLGDKGIYILGDITNLPFKEDSMDAVLSLHTIYHVPADEQDKAFVEIHRILAVDSSAAIVYGWGRHSLLMNMTLFPFKLFNLIVKLIRKPFKNNPLRNELYYQPHNYRWLKRQNWEFNFKIFVWRSVFVEFQKRYIHAGFGGNQILAFLYYLEEKFPRFFGQYGAYPIIVIDK